MMEENKSKKLKIIRIVIQGVVLAALLALAIIVSFNNIVVYIC